MIVKISRTTRLGFGIALLSCVFCSGAAEQSRTRTIEMVAPNSNPVLQHILNYLGAYSTFRRPVKEIDRMFQTFCVRSDSVIRTDVHYYEYACPPETGIIKMSVDARTYPDSNFIMTAAIGFDGRSFNEAKRILESNLGRPKRNLQDFVWWTYRRDKELNSHGNPAFTLMRDGKDAPAMFYVALEQGP